MNANSPIREWFRFVFEVVGLSVALYVAYLTIQSTKAAIKSADTAAEQFRRTERAVLLANPPQQVTLDMFALPISNVGHVATESVSLRVQFLRLDRRGAQLEERVIDVPVEQHIPPGDKTYEITVVLPPEDPEVWRRVSRNQEHLVVRGHLNYDSGFGEKEESKLCIQLKKGIWELCGAAAGSASAYFPDSHPR